MIENRLELNTRPKYELPNEVVVGEYRYTKNKLQYREPNFEPDICIGNFGMGCIGKEFTPKEVCNQLWVKTNNTELVNFIRKYNWKISDGDTGSSCRGLKIWKFKKIILEEFYGIKGE